jgi:4-amino-4-deoxy-L-arabinose transferase-like glycosyltransferase
VSTASTTYNPDLRPREAAALPVKLCLVLLIAAWAIVYLPGLFHPPLLDDADSVHAEAAKEILQRGDWVTLHANGVRYLEKAPLMYWAIAASFKLFGVHDGSARLPLALGALALVLVTWSLGRRVYGDAGGLFAALVLVTSFGPYIFTRFLIPDLLVGLWLLLTFDFFLRALDEERPSRVSCWGIAVASALNVLTKGLIGLVFPAAVIFAYLLLARDLRRLLRMRLVSSTVVFLIVAAPWHILAGLRNPGQGSVRGFFWFYFVNEHFLRYLNKRVPRDYDTVPLLLFWGLMLVWLLPWSAFLPEAMAKAVRGGIARVHTSLADRRQRANLVFGLWALVILVFFSFSTRQEYYVLPAVPALALLIGGWLGEEAESLLGSSLRRAGRISALVLMCVGIAAGAAAVFFAAVSKTPPPGYDIADLLTKHPEEYALSFGHIFDMTPQALGAFRLPMLGVGLSLAIGGVVAWMWRRVGRPRTSNLALAAAAVAMLGFVHQGFVTFSPTLTSRDLARAVESRWHEGDLIVIDGDYEDGSTLNYYTGHPVRVLNHREANLWYGSYWPDAPRVFETNETFLQLWDGDQRVFLWSQTRELELLRGRNIHEVAHSGGKYILSNRP